MKTDIYNTKSVELIDAVKSYTLIDFFNRI